MLAFTVHVGRKVSEWDECIYKNKIKTAFSEHAGKNKALGDTPQKRTLFTVKDGDDSCPATVVFTGFVGSRLQI